MSLLGNYTTGNVMTCEGFGAEGMSFLGTCSIGWCAYALVFLINLIANRQLNNMSIVYNKFIGGAAGFLGWLLGMSLIKSPGIALVIGVAATIGGGILGASIAGETDSEGGGSTSEGDSEYS